MKITNNIEQFNNSENVKFKLSASTGFVIAIPKNGEDIFYFVTEADKQMYNEKRKKKAFTLS